MEVEERGKLEMCKEMDTREENMSVKVMIKEKIKGWEGRREEGW